MRIYPNEFKESTMIPRYQIYETDVLIVGAGLAGLRAGISALENGKRIRVTAVSERKGPSGSSFTNMNNMLGMIVCRNDFEKNAFLNSFFI